MSDIDEVLGAVRTQPAATVHGTGSGGPKDVFTGTTTGITNWNPEYNTGMSAPTPPASPTVTLTRETFDKLCEAWATRSVNFEHNCVTLDFGAAEEIEALLRAAERQK